MRWVISLALLALISCRENIQHRQAGGLNFDSLLESKTTLLTAKGASLEKVSMVNGAASTVNVGAQEINWGEELKAFGVLELINKPIYSSAYDVKEKSDEKSNLMVKIWAAKADAPVRSVKIFYLNSPHLLKRLEAKVEQTNFVFSSAKNLTLEFDVFSDIPVLKRYEISGTQNFFWGAPQYYSIEGFIRVK